MKKTYQSPSMTVDNMLTAQMLASSTMGLQGDYDSSNVTMGSRRGNFDWDDEEYDEEFGEEFGEE